MPVLGQRPCSWGEEHIHSPHKPQTLDASGTGVPRHLVLGENCNVPISSGHLLTSTPILEVLLLPPSLGLPGIWLRLNCSVPVAIHFVSIASEDLMGANSWLALPHNWNWCGMPFCSLGDRAWSCGGDCGCSFFFCVSFSWNFFFFTAWPQRESRVGVKQGELTKCQLLKEKFFHQILPIKSKESSPTLEIPTQRWSKSGRRNYLPVHI